MAEIERLVKENNRMLRAMRRAAFWGGLIKWGLYIAFFIVLPWWAYQTYFAPVVGDLQHALNQVQGVTGKAQQQLNASGLQDLIKQAQEKLQELQTKGSN